MIGRRRFLAISAAAVGGAACAAGPTRWHGFALGAKVSIELTGPTDVVEPALRTARARIARVEALFSLYDPASLLSQLNRDKVLDVPPADFLDLCQQANKIHNLTGGLFDPTVQAFWTASSPPPEALGWNKVRITPEQIEIGRAQALTFNGIAQGYATDLVADALRAAGLQDIHVNIGEQLVKGRARRLGLVDPVHGLIGPVTVHNGAVATSSPEATPGHIRATDGRAPVWSTISVVADHATLADGVSTALCLAPRSVVARVRAAAGVRRILAVDDVGDLVSF